MGQTLNVLVEGRGEVEGSDGIATGEPISIGRSYRDAPEIDGVVLIEGDVPAGEMVPVRITGAMAYDLVGTVAWEGRSVVGVASLTGVADQSMTKNT